MLPAEVSSRDHTTSFAVVPLTSAFSWRVSPAWIGSWRSSLCTVTFSAVDPPLVQPTVTGSRTAGRAMPMIRKATLVRIACLGLFKNIKMFLLYLTPACSADKVRLIEHKNMNIF
jgi:hypothetical protein